MNLINIGGASAILEHDGIRILFDPWLKDGIMNGSWFHYPPINTSPADIHNVDYIYISHIHEDHCHADTLRAITPNAEILIMDREPEIPNFVARFLNANKLSFKKIHLIKPYTPTNINGLFIIDMLTADPLHEYNYLVDSAAIIKWGKTTIYNSNDCAPHSTSSEYIKKNYGQIDLALLPYSGGSAYPGCYSNLSHHTKLEEKERIFQEGASNFIKNLKELKPTLAMPFADQYVIGGNNSLLNQYLPHPPCPGSILPFIEKNIPSQKLLLLNPGQSYDLETGFKSPNTPYKFHTDEDRDSYIKDLPKIKYGHESFTVRDSVPLFRILLAARSRLWAIQKAQNNFPDYEIYLSLSDRQESYKIDLKSSKIETGACYENNMPTSPRLVITMSSALLLLTLINQIPWNISESFMDFHREPNIFNKEVYALLNNLIL